MKFLFFIALAVIGFNAQATNGCLVGNTFYTSYIGMVTTTNGSFTGSKTVWDSQGSQHAINYSGSNIACQVTAPNGSIPRDGALCFVMPRSQYNSYPNGVAPNYPSMNGTQQNFTIYNCPVDGFLTPAVLIFGVVGFLQLRNRALVF